jgi:hypothetical protein
MEPLRAMDAKIAGRLAMRAKSEEGLSTMSPHPLRPLKQAAQFLLGVPTEGINPALDRMLELAQATPLCFVAVAGPGAGDAMCQLWRRGYQRVEAARRATCRAADERSDVLLVIDCATAHDARAVVAATYTMLRPGGTLVVDASALLDEAPRRALADGLRELGLDVQPQAHLGAEILATRPFSNRKAA